MRFYLAIDIGASSGRHIVGWKENGTVQTKEVYRFPGLDFDVTPHQLRHTYITNLIHASVDPKTVQYFVGHENSKITMDIYAKVKYNKPDELVGAMAGAFALWDATV